MNQNVEEAANVATDLPPAVLAGGLMAGLNTSGQQENQTETLLIVLPPDLEQRLAREASLQGMTPEQYANQAIKEHLAQLEKERREKMQSLRAWNDQYSKEEQKETWDYLVRVLDEDRPSERKLFPEEMKGVSW
ncbi:MAG: hypothetical protein ABI977_34830 [Acidobacteriota bacterium]